MQLKVNTNFKKQIDETKKTQPEIKLIKII